MKLLEVETTLCILSLLSGRRGVSRIFYVVCCLVVTYTSQNYMNYLVQVNMASFYQF